MYVCVYFQLSGRAGFGGGGLGECVLVFGYACMSRVGGVRGHTTVSCMSRGRRG